MRGTITLLVAVACAVLWRAAPVAAQVDDDGPAAAESSAAPQDGAAPGARPDPLDSPRWWEQEPPDPQSLRDDPDAHAELLAEHGILLDLEHGTVSVRGGTLYDVESLEYPVEYLVVTEKGKTYEAVFMIRALPAVLDACLRATGLVPGNPTRSELKDPLPPEELIMSGEASPWNVVRAAGPVLALDVRWTDDAGRPRRATLESLLIDLRTGEPPEELGWIYTGSRRGQIRQGRDLVEVFLANVHGNVVAIWLDGIGADLLERNDPGALENVPYTINPETMPPRGTPVTITFRDTGRRVEPRPMEDGSGRPAGEAGADGEGTAGGEDGSAPPDPAPAGGAEPGDDAADSTEGDEPDDA